MISVNFYFRGELITSLVLYFNICIALFLIRLTLYLVCLIEAVNPVFQANYPNNIIKGAKLNAPASDNTSTINYA